MQVYQFADLHWNVNCSENMAIKSYNNTGEAKLQFFFFFATTNPYHLTKRIWEKPTKGKKWNKLLPNLLCVKSRVRTALSRSRTSSGKACWWKNREWKGIWTTAFILLISKLSALTFCGRKSWWLLNDLLTVQKEMLNERIMKWKHWVWNSDANLLD